MRARGGAGLHQRQQQGSGGCAGGWAPLPACLWMALSSNELLAVYPPGGSLGHGWRSRASRHACTQEVQHVMHGR